MAKKSRESLRRVTFSLRLKIILTFFIISAGLASLLSAVSSTVLERSLFAGLQARVGNLTRIGSALVDRGALHRLLGRLNAKLDADQVRAIELSADYRLLSDQLNWIRDSEKALVRYVYLFAPTDDVNMARYVVDADVLSLFARHAAGEKVDDAGISSFGAEFDVSPFPVACLVIGERTPKVEPRYSWDADFRVKSLSGYAPVLDADGKTLLAVLGLDMVDTDVSRTLASVQQLSLVIAGVAVLLAFASSVILGGLFTRGIVYLDRVVNRFGENRFDARAEIRSRDEVGRLGRSFNVMAETIQGYSTHLEALLSAYGRFVPKDFLQFLEKKSVVEVELGDQVQLEMAVLFSDIRAFTDLAESLTPQETFRFLNSYLSRVGPRIREHRGFIDKYIGDAIMALFPQSADDAVAAAIAMMKTLAEYNEHRQLSGYRPIGIGIGIHTGRLILGTIGEHERMDGTVIADAVNLASRLQGLTRIYGVSVLITGHTLGQLRGVFHHRYIDTVRVKGRRESVVIHEIFDADPPEVRERKEKTAGALRDAIASYDAKDMRAALAKLESLKSASPDDRILDIYIERCRRLLAAGIPEDWTGVEDVTAM